MDEAISLLRKAADVLQGANNMTTTSNTSTSTASTCSNTMAVPSSSSTSTSSMFKPTLGLVAKDVKRLFKPYHGRQSGSTSKWTHKFFCLSSNESISVPGKEERKMLFEAGLGEKRITFERNTNTESFKNCIVSHFSKLEGCGGFELLRSSNQSRSALEVIRPDKFGYNSEYLASSYLGQAVCYIRPIQQSMDITAVDAGDSVCTEKCRTCGHDIPLTELRDHVRSCVDCNEKEDMELPEIKRPRKQSKDQPICGFACNTKITPVEDKKEISVGSCPICSEKFEIQELEEHADMCANVQIGTAKEPDVKYLKSTFKDSLMELAEALNEKVFNITVVRRKFIQTAMEQLSEADEADWSKKFRVKFIGEEGVDSGGLTREFFSLLFKETPLFEKNSFSLQSDLLSRKSYQLLGKATAMALVLGHPGPRCLDAPLVEYIITGLVPNLSTIADDEIRRLDVLAAIEEMRSVSDETQNETNIRYSDMLQAAGFNRRVSQNNNEDAIVAIKSYYLFYRYLPALLQFIEGLKIHNVLHLLRSFKEEGFACLGKTPYPAASEVVSFFLPVYSVEKEEKAVEEIVMYNFTRFLTRIERGRIQTKWLSFDDTEEEEVILNVGHLLQALVGSPNLPSNIPAGIIEFDHGSKHLPTVNTCAPSIKFTNPIKYQSYEEMEECMINIIIGSYGFGIE